MTDHEGRMPTSLRENKGGEMQKWEICSLSSFTRIEPGGLVSSQKAFTRFSAVAYTPSGSKTIYASGEIEASPASSQAYEKLLAQLLDDGWEPMQFDTGGTIRFKRPVPGT